MIIGHLSYMSRRRAFMIAGAAALFLIGYSAAILLRSSGSAQAKATAPSQQVRADDSQYKFINPLLFSNNAKSAALSPLNDLIQSYIAKSKSAGSADSVSVYYREVNTGNWTGVGEDDPYSPSSMLKVIVMMATLKLAETDDAILSKKLYYSGPDDSGQYYKPADGLQIGYYTIQDLLHSMIVYSDNGALESLLSDTAIHDQTNETYALFRLTPDKVSPQADFLSAKSYSVVYRVLFNSTYFAWSLSDQILNVLSHTTFNKGIVAGVPAETIVAHKFGENTSLSSGVRELHDCGIVYHPANPYLLCVMTKGKEFPHLETVVSGMSKLIYSYVDSKQAAGI